MEISSSTAGAVRRTSRLAIVVGAGLMATIAILGVGPAHSAACPPDRPLCRLLSPPTPTVTTPPSPIITLPPVTLPPVVVTLPPILVPQPVPEAAQRLLDLANVERAKAGMGSLTSRGDVAAIALTHSTTMVAAGNIFHNDIFFSGATRLLLNSEARGENVAANSSVDDTHARLMNSPGHRANILDPRFSVAGFAVVRGTDGRYYTTENFLQPRGGPPVAAPAVPTRVRPAPAVPTSADKASVPAAPPAGALTVPDGAPPAELAGADPISSLEEQSRALTASTPTGATPLPVAASLPAAVLLLAVAIAIAVQIGRHPGSGLTLRP